MDLGAKVVTALRWAGGAKLGGQLITWAVTLIVIRILSPEDYGLMAMALVFLQFLMLLNELGLGAVLVQRRDLDDAKIEQIFGLIILINSGFFAVLFGSAPLIAAFFGEDRLVEIIRVMSLQFVMSAFSIVPVAMLDRSLDFKRKSLVYLGANIAGAIATLVLALTGFGVWALVWGNMAVVGLQVIGVNFVALRHYRPRISFDGVREIFAFGGPVTLERGMWFFYTQADVFIVGKIFGKELLGFYSVAMHLSSLIMHKTGGILYEVAFPSFAKIQEEPGRLSAYFIKAVRIMSLVTFPLFFGMSAVSHEAVAVLLGENWLPSAPVLTILVLVMPLRMLSNLFPPALQGIGRPGKSVINLTVAMIVMPIAFLVGTADGIRGVALAWTLAFPVAFFAMLFNSRKALGVTLGRFLGAVSLPLVASGVMFAIIEGASSMLALDLYSITNLVVLIAVGVLSYLVMVLGFGRERLDELIGVVRR